MTQRIRAVLSGLPNVEEKKMFRGTTFMVNGKMCISSGDDEFMFRLDNEHFDSLSKMDGCRPMIRNGMIMNGFIYVKEKKLNNDEELGKWINLALYYNQKITKKKNK